MLQLCLHAPTYPDALMPAGSIMCETRCNHACMLLTHPLHLCLRAQTCETRCNYACVLLTHLLQLCLRVSQCQDHAAIMPACSDRARCAYACGLKRVRNTLQLCLCAPDPPAAIMPVSESMPGSCCDHAYMLRQSLLHLCLRAQTCAKQAAIMPANQSRDHAATMPACSGIARCIKKLRHKKNECGLEVECTAFNKKV